MFSNSNNTSVLDVDLAQCGVARQYGLFGSCLVVAAYSVEQQLLLHKKQAGECLTELGLGCLQRTPNVFKELLTLVQVDKQSVFLYNFVERVAARDDSQQLIPDLLYQSEFLHVFVDMPHVLYGKQTSNGCKFLLDVFDFVANHIHLVDYQQCFGNLFPELHGLDVEKTVSIS